MKNIKLFIPIFLLFIFSGCGEDFLNQPPRGVLTAGSFPVNENDAFLAINGVYNITRTWQINTGGFPLLDMMSDDAVKGSSPGDGTAVSVYDKFEHIPTEGSSERWYKTLYEAIRRANLVINEVTKIDMDAALRDRYIGEARFLRAYFYGQLVRGFGDVPKVIITEPELEILRSPVAEILNEIIYPDLEFAASILPKRSGYPASDLGRATSGAAKTLLARIKLYYGDFAAVEALTREVIQSGEYSLVDDVNEIFTWDNEHNEESIFELSAKAENFNDGGNQYGNTQGVRGSPNKGWGFCRPAYPLIEEYQNNNDPRRDPTILFVNEEVDGTLILGDGATPDTTYDGNKIVEIECYNQKVWFPGADGRTSFAHNRRIMRYADVLLMYAEALNENGKSSEALPFLNMIRARARNGNANVLPEVVTTNKDQLRDAIILERKYELALEGLRFWDLVRTNKAEAILGPLGFQKNKNELFPIPQSEIDISQGRITQNPGY